MLTLEEKVNYLLDRQAILDCINSYTRGLDRHDDEMLADAFHPDAIDNHGFWAGPREAFVKWANYECHSALGGHAHNITSHTCEIDGDEATAESYVIFVHRFTDGKTVNVGGGRYLDRLEKRDGKWRLSFRRLVVDYRFTADGSVFGDWDGYPKGAQDKSDISYDRPYRLPDEIQRRVDRGDFYGPWSKKVLHSFRD